MGIFDFLDTQQAKASRARTAEVQARTKQAEIESLMAVGDWGGVVDKLGGNYGPEQKSMMVERFKQMDELRRGKMTREAQTPGANIIEGPRGGKFTATDNVARPIMNEAGGQFMGRPPEPSLTGEKAAEIQRINAKVEAKTATAAEKVRLEKMYVGSGTTVNVGGADTFQNVMSAKNAFRSDARVKDMDVVQKFTDNVLTAYKRSLTAKNLGATDIALAKSFQKLTDLGSAVREGEFATTFEGQKLVSKVIGAVERVIKGGLGFSQAERTEIKELSLLLMEDSKKLYNSAYGEYNTLGTEFGLNTKAMFGGAKPFKMGVPVKDTTSAAGIISQFTQPAAAQEPAKTATNPKTGETLYLYKDSTKWEKKRP